MSDFIFSLNCTMPVFLMMVLGYCLYHGKMLTQDFVDVCDTLVFNVTLPVMLFRDMAKMDIEKDFDVYFVLYCAVASVIGILAAWLLAKLLAGCEALPRTDREIFAAEKKTAGIM